MYKNKKLSKNVYLEVFLSLKIYILPPTSDGQVLYWGYSYPLWWPEDQTPKGEIKFLGELLGLLLGFAKKKEEGTRGGEGISFLKISIHQIHKKIASMIISKTTWGRPV